MLPLRRLQITFTQTIASYSRLLTTSPVTRGLEEFFDAPAKEGEAPPVVGRAWKAEELRTKSFDDLQKLWYVLLKERNMLESEKLRARADGRRLDNPTRLVKVRKSMARIKSVLTERALAEPSKRRQSDLKKVINAL